MITTTSSSNALKSLAIEMSETESSLQQRICICSVRQTLENCRTFCNRRIMFFTCASVILGGCGALAIKLIEKASVSSILEGTGSTAAIMIPLGALVGKGIELVCLRAIDAWNDRNFRRGFTRGMPKEDQEIALKEFKLINSLPEYSEVIQMPLDCGDTQSPCEQGGERVTQLMQSGSAEGSCRV